MMSLELNILIWGDYALLCMEAAMSITRWLKDLSGWDTFWSSSLFSYIEKYLLMVMLLNPSWFFWPYRIFMPPLHWIITLTFGLQVHLAGPYACLVAACYITCWVEWSQEGSLGLALVLLITTTMHIFISVCSSIEVGCNCTRYCY